jgi:hypothetical protein
MSLQPSRQLVLKKLHDYFPDEQSARDALSLLDTYGTESWHNERDRVHLAILKECQGSLDRVRALVELAKKDYRDALVGAEYPEEFQAPLNTPPHEKNAIRRRDRQQYEAWLESDLA